MALICDRHSQYFAGFGGIVQRNGVEPKTGHHLYGGNTDVSFVLGLRHLLPVADDRAGEDGNVACGRVVIFMRQARRIHEIAAGHAEVLYMKN